MQGSSSEESLCRTKPGQMLLFAPSAREESEDGLQFTVIEETVFLL